MDKNMKTTVVTTTIFIPTFLSAYVEIARHYQHRVDFIVIGDRKTPLETTAFCATIPNCTYLDLKAQDKYLLRFPLLADHLPIDSVERRNIGMLMAYERAADCARGFEGSSRLSRRRRSAGPGDDIHRHEQCCNPEWTHADLR